MKSNKQILITVGTTKFENLIKSIDKPEFYDMLQENNFTKVIIQKGSGEYIPNNFKNCKNLGIHIQIENLLPNFEDIIKNSDYIVSHGGAGNVLEALKYKKNIFVVVNDQLMDNHQVELAESLAKDNYVFYVKDISGNNLVDYIANTINKKLKLREYPEFNLDVIPNVIYEMLDIN
jgi:beta-1,4-N-acetylglucosaminyltransferase